MADIKIGGILWPQATDWPALRDAAVATDRSGWDSLWTWDHLFAIQGPWEQSNFEAWTTLAAWAALTRDATVGLLVSANTFRNPGLTAKLATTLDHISGGRAVLGIGGAWFEREHGAHGIDFGRGVGERLDRLDEAVSVIRRLLDGTRVNHHGPHYSFHDALHAPRPVQPHLPIVVGGSGPRKTLRTVARYGDAWHTHGSLAEVTGHDAILRRHCADVGRDETTIERMIGVWTIIRDDAEDAHAVAELTDRHHGLDPANRVLPALCGSPAAIADALRSYVEAGFRHIIVDVRPPFDHQTIERMPEVRELLQR